MNKGQSGSKQPKVGGINAIDVSSSQSNVPSVYFAGTRKLSGFPLMPAVVSKVTDSSSGGSKGGKGGSSSASKDFYGHMAWELDLGQIDAIWGLMVDNNLGYPNASIWDSAIYQGNKTVIYIDGNVYQTTVKTNTDPPSFPWTLLAIPWTAGTWLAGTKALYLGNVWQAVVNTTAAPSSLAPGNTLPMQGTPVSGDWKFVCTPTDWHAGIPTAFWPANSIVAWEGRLYTTPSGTKAQPPAAPWVLWKIDRGSSANPLHMTVTDSMVGTGGGGLGDWYLYWGTPTQTLDVGGEAILNALGHPPYRNRAVLVAKNVLFGSSRTTPPDPTLLAFRLPVQSLIAGSACDPDADWQVNPWCVLAELLTHPVLGLGLPASYFNAASWQAQADLCAANPQLYYISPMFTSFKQVREFTSDILSYADAFVFWSVLGTLMAGHWPHGKAAPAWTAANTIDRNCLVSEIQSDTDLWGGTYNSVEVNFNDIQAAFNARPALANSLFNMSITKRLLTQSLDRPFIVRAAQAAAWASEFGKISAEQSTKGNGLTIQPEKATGVVPGSLFLLTDDVLGVSQVQRCTAKTTMAAPRGLAKISHVTERGVSAQAYSPTNVNPQAPSGPAPSALTNATFIDLPPALVGFANSIGCLAGRNDSTTSAFQVWFREADTAAFQEVATQSSFAVPAMINDRSTFSSNTETFVGAVHRVFYALAHDNVFNVTARRTVPGFPGSWVTLTPGTDFITMPGYIYCSASLGGGNLEVTYDYVAAGIAWNYNDFFSANLGDTCQVSIGPVPQGDIYEIQVFTSDAMGVYWDQMVEGVDFTFDYITGIATIASSSSVFINGNTLRVWWNQSVLLKLADGTPQADVDAISFSPTEDQINDGAIMLAAYQAANPKLFELMTVKSLTALGSGWYGATVRRTQYGTTYGGDGTHEFVDDPCFITLKSNVLPITNAAFPSLAASATDGTFRISPSSAWVQADVADVWNAASNPSGLTTEFIHSFSDPWAPTAQWTQLLQNGTAISSFSGSFLTTDVMNFTFEIDDMNGDLESATLVASLGQQEIVLWTGTFVSGNTISKTVQFSFPSPGLWSLTLTSRDHAGNATTTPLSLPGSTTPVQVTVTLPASTVTPTPIMSQYTVNGQRSTFYVSNVKFKAPASGTTIYYQLQTKGTAPVGGSWVALAGVGPVPTFPTTKTLYAYAHKTGQTDSQVVFWNFTNQAHL